MQRAVNPKTGEVVFLVDNQWVKPSQTAVNPETGGKAYLVNNTWQEMPVVKLQPAEPTLTPEEQMMGSIGQTSPKEGLLAGTTLPAEPGPMNNRMIEEVGTGLTSSSSAQLPKLDASKMQPESNATLRTLSDVGKLVGGEAVRGAAGAPEAVQQAATAPARETFTAPSEIANLIADPRLLANKLSTNFGFSNIFDIEKPLEVVPNELIKKQSAALDQTFTKGKIPALTALTNYGNKVSKEIQDSVSPEMKDAMASTEVTGNLVKALGTGDFSGISFGKDPNALGLLGQASKVFGSTGTALALGLLTKSPTVGGAAGFGMAGAEGVDTAKEHISKMSDQELNNNSEYFRNLVVLGYDKKTAREMTIDKAASTAALTQGLVGSLGGQFTTKLVSGQLDSKLINAARQKLGAIVENRAARIAGGAGVGMTEEGLQELAEGIASDLSIDRTVVREIGVDSFANLVLGAIGGGGPGAVSGAKSEAGKPGEEAPPVPTAAELMKQKGFVVPPKAGVTVEAAPPEMATAQPIPQAPEAPQPPPSLSQDTEFSMAELEGRPLPSAAPVTPVTAPAPAPVVEAKPEPKPEGHAVTTLQTQELPVSELKLSKDVPQFKSDANAKGVVEPLTGKFDRTGVAPIQVWERANGDLEVISGRHRLDLAKRTGEETIPAQIHKETEGFDALKAASLDALLNIREGQGKVKDYVTYFQRPGYTREEAESSGVLARATGKRAYSIATNGSSDLIAAHRADKLSDDAATKIADTAPNEDALQALGIKMIQDGKSIVNTVNTMQAVKAMSSERGETTLDMFGFDDSAMREAQEMAKIAARKQAEISNDLAAVTGAAKRPKEAAKYGINVNDPASILAKTDELRQQRAAWDNWSSSPELIAQIRSEMNPLEQPTPESLKAREEATKVAKAEEEKAAAEAEKATKAEREKKEIAKQSEAVADSFELGQTPEESLSGQEDIFAQPEKTQAEINRERQAEKKAKAEEKNKLVGTTTEDGFKIQVPFLVQLNKLGYEMLPLNNPRTYVDKGGNPHRTFEKDGVRVAFDTQLVLFQTKGKGNQPPQMGMGNENDILFQHLTVDKDKRNKGLAKRALKDIVNIADETGVNVYLEPAQLENNGMTRQELSDLYSKYGFRPNFSGRVMKRLLGDDGRTIDVEATVITPNEFKLITNQVNKLSDSEINTLEEHYGEKSSSEAFAKRVREDIIRYVNQGAQVVDKAIRSIIAKLQAGLLSVAMIFNPAYMSQQSAVVYPTKVTTEQVKAVVPESASEMSSSGKKAFASIFPAIKNQDKLFTVVDKPTSKVFVFNPDGTLLAKDNVVLGMAMGDTYVGETDFKGNRVTPGGLFKVKAEKGSATYDGKTIYTVGNVAEGWNTAFMHTVYLKESDAEARKAALATGEKTRLSHGCVNASPEIMAKLEKGNRMDQSHVFVVPDNQAKIDDYISNNVSNKDLTRETVKPVTETRSTQTAKATPGESVVGKEEEFVTPTLSVEGRRNAAPRTRERMVNERILDEKIAELAKTNIRRAAIRNRFEKNALKPLDQDQAAQLRAYADELTDEIDTLKFVTRDLSAENFNFLAAKALKEETISKEVYDLIHHIFETRPDLLEGLKLQIRSPGENGPQAAGEFLGRIIRLYKGTSGVEDPAVLRHELTHSLEQMMTKDVKKKLVQVWGDKVVAAAKAEKTLGGKEFFEALQRHLANPTKESFEATSDKMPNMSYYQYMSPSEYWAVNAEPLMKAQLGGAWTRFQKFVKGLFEALKSLFGVDNKSIIYKTFDQVINGERLNKDMLVDYMRGVVPTYSLNPRKNYKGDKPPVAEWESPSESKLDDFAYSIQDKLIDTKRVIQAIKEKAGSLAEKWDAYMKEELYHGRTAKRTEDFLKRELLPLVEQMKRDDVTIADFDKFLHNRHAQEYNEHVAKINDNFPDGGSGIDTADAQEYLANLSPKQKSIYESLAKKLDAIVQNTQKVLTDSGVESQDTIDTWNSMFKYYVPLKRDNLDFVQDSRGLGQGFQVKGATSKRAIGSSKSVVDIFANIALQRERAIVRAEKKRVGNALYGLALQNPNPDFWLPVNPDAIKNKAQLEKELINLGISPEDAANLIEEPKTPRIDKKTGKVIYEINPSLRNSDNVFTTRVDGKDRYVFFNSSDPRAMRMVQAIKNLDAEQLGLALGTIGQVTRWVASVNTQYNPVFGAWNFARDLGGAAFNLSTTEIAGKQAQVTANVFPALFGIYKDLRTERKGKEYDNKWSKLWEQFQRAGGQTGYKEQFTKQKTAFKGWKPESKQVNIIEESLANLDKGAARRAAAAVFNWLSDYNDAMENAVRLSAFKVALDQGLSEEKAASIAKNLTVNFNRKGQISGTMGALFAFFNSAVQGTTRLGQTLAGPAGKKIIAGGLTLGVIQALALAMAGFDDDDPPQFLKDKNLIIPTGNGKYIIIPMPLGFNMIPGVGRISTEYVLGKMGLITGGKNLSRKAIDIAGLVLDSFNPLGGGSLAQVITPTVADPVIAITTNKDAFGRPISKEDRATAPTPGYTRSRENASFVSQQIAKFLNYASGGTKYQKGELSPTADQLDYLAGQYTGGVGREVQKVSEFIKSKYTGEEQPMHKIPVVGKLYGDINSPAAISAKFYQNVTDMAQHENEVKGRQKHHENVQAYFKEHPEAKMIDQTNRIENEITQLNKDRKALIERGASKDRIKRLEDIKINIMRQYNQRVIKAMNKKEGE